MDAHLLPRLQKACAPTIEAARRGELCDEDAQRLCSGALVSHMMVPSMLTVGRARAGDGTRTAAAMEQIRLASLCRPLFTRKAAWALFTIEWMDSMAALINELVHQDGGRGEADSEEAGQRAADSEDGSAGEGAEDGAHVGSSGRIRVLEVCAGISSLQAPMRARGLDWIATDLEVSEDAVSQPLRMAAEEAVRMQPPFDVCFWSWWTTADRPAASSVSAVAASATAAWSEDAVAAPKAAQVAAQVAGTAAAEVSEVEAEIPAPASASSEAAAETETEVEAGETEESADAGADEEPLAAVKGTVEDSSLSGAAARCDGADVICEPWHDDVYGRVRPEGWRRDVSALAARALVPVVLDAAVRDLGRAGDLVHVDAGYATDFLLA